MRKLLDKKIVAKNGRCPCNVEFKNFGDILPDHINPSGMGDHGETTIPLPLRQFIGGAMAKRDQAKGDVGEAAFSFTELLCPRFSA